MLRTLIQDSRNDLKARLLLTSAELRTVREKVLSDLGDHHAPAEQERAGADLAHCLDRLLAALELAGIVGGEAVAFDATPEAVTDLARRCSVSAERLPGLMRHALADLALALHVYAANVSWPIRTFKGADQVTEFCHSHAPR